MSLKLGSSGDKAVSLFQLYEKSIPGNWDGSSHSTTCVIGRGVDCSIRITYDEGESKLYKLISKKHAELVLMSTGILLRDAHSKNGTYVNGERLMDKEAKMLYNGDVISLGCPPRVREVRGAEALKINPYELSLTDMVSGYKDKIAVRIQDQRARISRQTGQPLSWNAIKRGFGMLGGDEGVHRDAKRDRHSIPGARKDVIDLTGADDDQGPRRQEIPTRQPDVSAKNNETQENNKTRQNKTHQQHNGQLGYEKGCVYVLERPMYVTPDVPGNFARMSLLLKYIPDEYLKVLEESSSGQNLRMVRVGNVRKVLNRSESGEFENAFRAWYSRDFYPKKFLNLQNAYKNIEWSKMCYFGEPGQLLNGRKSARHPACPAVKIVGCDHTMCARCFLAWIESEKGRIRRKATSHPSPCCRLNMLRRPHVDRDLTDQICTRLKELGVWDDYTSITFEGRNAIENLIERTTSQISISFPNMAHANAPTQQAMQPMLAAGKMCGLGGPLKFGVESAHGVCSKCSKDFQPNDGMAFVIMRSGSPSTKSLYHMNCIQHGLKMRALTEGIHGYSAMDEAARHRALASFD